MFLLFQEIFHTFSCLCPVMARMAMLPTMDSQQELRFQFRDAAGGDLESL
jgi:hypothetical protein